MSTIENKRQSYICIFKNIILKNIIHAKEALTTCNTHTAYHMYKSNMYHLLFYTALEIFWSELQTSENSFQKNENTATPISR